MKGPWVKETLPSLGNPPEHGCGPAWLDHSSLGTRPKAGLPLLKPIWDFQINADSEFSISLKLHNSICVLHDFCSIFLWDQLLSPRDCWQKQIWTTEMACPHLSWVDEEVPWCPENTSSGVRLFTYVFLVFCWELYDLVIIDTKGFPIRELGRVRVPNSNPIAPMKAQLACAL